MMNLESLREECKTTSYLSRKRKIMSILAIVAIIIWLPQSLKASAYYFHKEGSLANTAFMKMPHYLSNKTKLHYH